MLLSILSEMTRDLRWSVYVETASLMLAAHLIRGYSDSGACETTIVGSPKPDQSRLRSVLDFISDQIADQITLAKLAEVAGLSTFHFARMFRYACRTAASIRLAEHKSEGDDKQLLTEVVADVQGPATPIFEATRSHEGAHDAGCVITRLGEVIHDRTATINQDLAGIGAMKKHLGHAQPRSIGRQT
jgi:AraC-like DNA-binding protein